MKWILLWTAVTAQGGVTSGTAQFENVEACFKAEQTVAATMSSASKSMEVKATVDTYCVNVETGARKSYQSSKF
ncbi:hypothetical protein FHR71_005524 [Methylobacterium sp. RAS18]|nr:hypothetical protein [Methylobacterium sp. RAS18]